MLDATSLPDPHLTGVPSPFALASQQLRPQPAPPKRLTWLKTARTQQLPPPGDWWEVWFILAGRGFGKTRSGAEHTAQFARDNPGAEIGVIGRTDAEARRLLLNGPSGLLSVLETWEIKRCVQSPGDTILELVNGSKIYVAGANSPDSLRGLNLWMAWCVASGELVSTSRGDVPIESVAVGDQVMTRQGWCPVTATRRTKRAAATVTIRTADGSSVRCTPDHRVWTETRGWVLAETVTPSDTMLAWRNTIPSPARPPISSGTASGGTSTAATATTATEPDSYSTEPCGPTSTGRSLTATKSTTSTTTERTTRSATSTYASRSTTGPTTPTSEPMRPGATSKKAKPRPSVPADSGTSANHNPSPAPSAAPSTSRPACGHDSAPQTAAHATAVVSVAHDSTSVDVYDLTVDGAHEFYAGGLLVHNCDELAAWRYQQLIWDEVLDPAVRIGPHPHVLVTTTPKPTKLVRSLLKDEGTVTVRGSTFDNVANLAASFIRRMRRKYDGTRTGRQELYAEVLDDVPGALVTRDQLDASRVEPTFDEDGTLLLPVSAKLDGLYREAVVALDPADGTDEGDEQAIALVGLGYDHELYIEDTQGMKASVTEYLGTVVDLAVQHRATIVVEKNHGGRYLIATLDQVMREKGVVVPVRVVTASEGKRVRAEPIVPLFTRRKLHFVGSHPDVEDQLCSWVGAAGEKSPDRMDAVVWGVTHFLRHTLEPDDDAGSRDGTFEYAQRPGKAEWTDDDDDMAYDYA